MAFTALLFVVLFLTYYVLCNLSYDVTRWTWCCNKTENHACLWIDLTKLAQTLLWFKHSCHSDRLVPKFLSSFKIILDVK